MCLIFHDYRIAHKKTYRHFMSSDMDEVEWVNYYTSVFFKCSSCDKRITKTIGCNSIFSGSWKAHTKLMSDRYSWKFSANSKCCDK